MHKKSISNIRFKVLLIVSVVILTLHVLRIIQILYGANVLAQENTNVSIVKLQPGSILYQKLDNDLIQVQQNTKKSLFQKDQEVILENEDIAEPNNVDSVITQMDGDNMSIYFNRPKDNGTEYIYRITKGSNNKELSFYSESGIQGYSYAVDNVLENQADTTLNKLDESAIIVSNIDYSKDYYLHIRTMDNSGNISKNKTFKIDIKSDGICVKYVDSNGEILAPNEYIYGAINDEYDVKGLEKKIDGYTFIYFECDYEGKLTKECKDVKYHYAKNCSIRIKYINKLNNKEIKEDTVEEGYENKKIQIVPKKISNYYTNSKNNEVILQPGENIIKLFYTPVTKNSTEIKKDNNTQRYITVKCVDIDTNKILRKDSVVVNSNNKAVYKLRRIEGYQIVKNKDNSNKKDSLIDEIISSIDTDNKFNVNNELDSLTEDEKNMIDEQYEIVMNCDESDYIIYYKK